MEQANPGGHALAGADQPVQARSDTQRRDNRRPCPSHLFERDPEIQDLLEQYAAGSLYMSEVIASQNAGEVTHSGARENSR